MNVSKLLLRNYRNFKEENINLEGKINIIYGENAQGKTNIIEALWLLTGGKSFRNVKDMDLIMFGEQWASVEGNINLCDRELKVRVKIDNGKRLAEVNDIKRGTAASIVGMVKSVVFSPEHLNLIKGGPESRRKFLDAAICQLKPTYLSLLIRYNKILKQRNALLKDTSGKNKFESTIDVWDFKICECAVAIVWERINYLKKVSCKASDIFVDLSSEDAIKLGYKEPQIDLNMTLDDIKRNISSDMERYRKLDIKRGFTSIGPHRDDVVILINNKSAKFFSSQGQQRSAVIALKLAEAEIIKEVTSEKPIVLFDDIMSELDEKRQNYMFKNINGMQTIITGCIKPRENKNYKLFKVVKGQVFYD